MNTSKQRINFLYYYSCHSKLYCLKYCYNIFDAFSLNPVLIIAYSVFLFSTILLIFGWIFQISTGENEIKKIIQTEVQIGKFESYGINLQIKLETNSISTSKRFGYFEDAIIDIQNQLPNDEKIKCCLSCKLSHYNPYGNGMFGYLFCFKKIKEKTNQIEDKDSLFDVWELADKKGKVFSVQEIHLCEEHEFITDKDWNYSNWK